MSNDESWDGTVVKKSRAMLDGSSLYRRLTIRTESGQTQKVRVDRALWKELEVGDRILKEAGADPHRA
ncbi:hypothetical protein SAMN05428985_104467 [Nocardioides sp. YR527]|uniref:DUF7489 domain-containing protein n=1 Tax=Nocardioides sp. YR527 TaxID=1881028 RepID=UPI000881139F|nr:hypothetical protein [Nocardioides sp. YR527]SDK55160.1 hypothetical protein SAMN05428985_104467 [Nocardioides sp. YR527]